MSADIQKYLAQFFLKHLAKPVTNPHYKSGPARLFDYAVAAFETEDLRLRFVRVRGEFSVEVASLRNPERWEDVITVVAWVREREGINERFVEHGWGYFVWPVLDWEDISEFLLTHWETLKCGAERIG